MCLLNPVPSKLYGEILPLISSVILDPVIYVQWAFKIAVIKPLLEMSSLDPGDKDLQLSSFSEFLGKFLQISSDYHCTKI